MKAPMLRSPLKIWRIHNGKPSQYRRGTRWNDAMQTSVMLTRAHTLTKSGQAFLNSQRYVWAWNLRYNLEFTGVTKSYRQCRSSSILSPQNAYRSPPNGNSFKAVFDVMLLLEAKWPSNQNILIADTILAKPCLWPGFKVSEQNTF